MASSNLYISKAQRKDIPSGAILLTEDEVLKMRWQMIKDWKPVSDVWPFHYGIGVLTAGTSLTAVTIIKHFRNKLKLGRYGQVTMVLPNLVLPTIMANFTHTHAVSQSLFLGTECPLCIETRAAAAQVISAVAFPLILVPMASFYYASTYGVIDIPPIRRENLKDIGQLWMKILRPFRYKLLVIIGINALMGSGLTYFEVKSFFKCQQVLYNREEQFRKLLTKE